MFLPFIPYFASGGCDRTVVTWDGLYKKKLTVLPLFETSIAALAFNHDGTQLAIAISYPVQEGDKHGIDIDGNNNENRKKVKDEIYYQTHCRHEITLLI